MAVANVAAVMNARSDFESSDLLWKICTNLLVEHTLAISLCSQLIVVPSLSEVIGVECKDRSFAWRNHKSRK